MLNKRNILIILLTIFLMVNCNEIRKDNNSFTIYSKVPIDDTINCKIFYKNSWKKLLDIKEIKYSCGCMSGKIEPFRLQFNKYKLLSFNLHVNYYDTILKKRIFLITRSNKIITLDVTINLNFDFKYYPQNRIIRFDRCKLNNKYFKNFKIVNNSDSDIIIEKIECNNKSFIIDSKSQLFPFTIIKGKTLESSVIFSSNVEGINSGRIVLSFDLPNNKTVNYHVYALVEK